MSDTKISEALVKIANEAQQDFFDAHKLSEFFCSGHYHEESMRAALEAVLPHLHPQTAELAEQQGDAWTIAELVRTDLDQQTCPDHYMRVAVESVVKHVEAWQAALAATGKQQVGAFPWENLPAYLIDKCEGDTISEEGIQRAVADMAKDARYCPPQQVGEVQGLVTDVQIEHAMRAYAKVNEDNGEPQEFFPDAMHAALLAALAARQPGAQGPKFTTEDGSCWHHAGKAFIVTVDGDTLQLMVTDGPRIEFIGDSRPYRVPAQGIHLGQLWEPIKEAVHTALSVHLSALSQKKREQVAVYVARQLRDGQRDSAPGVE